MAETAHGADVETPSATIVQKRRARRRTVPLKELLQHLIVDFRTQLFIVHDAHGRLLGGLGQRQRIVCLRPGFRPKRPPTSPLICNAGRCSALHGKSLLFLGTKLGFLRGLLGLLLLHPILIHHIPDLLFVFHLSLFRNVLIDFRVADIRQGLVHQLPWVFHPFVLAASKVTGNRQGQGFASPRNDHFSILSYRHCSFLFGVFAQL
mmetsp:Transcript_16068/g.46028  ORF Transcript_16068/g.46028 Transcript_16068/m.46028 type:complete len:206 (+) Transcript_16068:528-1145(+)